MDPFLDFVRALQQHHVRFVLIGVSGVNYYASHGSLLFTTVDHDLFLPLNTRNMLGAWRAAESFRLRLSAAAEPLDVPRDEPAAQAVVDRRALVTASDGQGLTVDLTLVMAGFDFETVWRKTGGRSSPKAHSCPSRVLPISSRPRPPLDVRKTGCSWPPMRTGWRRC